MILKEDKSRLPICLLHDECVTVPSVTEPVA